MYFSLPNTILSISGSNPATGMAKGFEPKVTYNIAESQEFRSCYLDSREFYFLFRNFIKMGYIELLKLAAFPQPSRTLSFIKEQFKGFTKAYWAFPSFKDKFWNTRFISLHFCSRLELLNSKPAF